MIYKHSHDHEFSQSLFQNPPSEYRGFPFWSWNCEVTEELVDEQIDIYQKMGMGGFHLHPRTGLQTPYMGERYMELVRRADERAKEHGMLCCLYDEDRYPSGAAGGLVTEDLHYRQRFLLLSQGNDGAFCENADEFERQIQRGDKPIGYYLTSYQVVLDENGCLSEYRRIGREEPCADGVIWHAYVRLAKESPWFNDQTYLDVLNKRAVERFIEVTHERYYQELGDEFGKSIPSIFTDEPQIAGKFSFVTPTQNRDATISYTDDMNDSFQEEFGVALLDILPEILWELPDGKVSVHRYHYHDHLAERFARAFSDTIGEWCERHGIAFTGHFMSERTLYSQTLALSEAMRQYRSFQLPGVDILTDAKEITTVKQAASVSRQYGREGVMAECYGAMNWDIDFKMHKLQGDWLCALGVTSRAHHLTFMSMEGEAKRDWPASIGYQSPWYLKYSYLEDHHARVTAALTRGKAVVKTAVLSPIESYWILYGPNSQTHSMRDQLDSDYENLMQWLLYGTIDFDLISESLLPQQCDLNRIDSGLPVGEMRYDVVVVPGLLTIRSSTLDRLERFRDAGGQIVFAGHVPSLVDAEVSDRAEKLAGRCVQTEFERAYILEALKPYRTVEIRQGNGMLSDNLFYQMREEGDDRWLFICHVNRKRNRLDKPEKYFISVNGIWSPTLYDTITGEITPVQATVENGSTIIKRHLFAEDSVLLKLTPGMPCEAKPQELPSGTAHKISCPVGFSLSEPNVFLLDYAQYALDGGEWSERKDILSIDNEIRAALGYPRRQDKFTQPWRLPDETPEHEVEMQLEFVSEIDISGAMLALERPENAVVTLNGQQCSSEPQGFYVDRSIQKIALSDIHRGVNRLSIKIPFCRKTNLEWMYILGEFGVRVAGDEAVIVKAADTLRFGSIVTQGFPFYTGNIHYELEASLPEGQACVYLEVPHFTAPVLEVAVDGKPAGIIAYAPHKLCLGALKGGVHTIEVTAFGNRFNGFGTIHNANDEFRWYGPDAYRTTGTQWSDHYLLKPFGVLSAVNLLY